MPSVVILISPFAVDTAELILESTSSGAGVQPVALLPFSTFKLRTSTNFDKVPFAASVNSAKFVKFIFALTTTVTL